MEILDLKKSLSKFATGVIIAAGQDQDSSQLYGLTINSFTSISLRPPLVSFCIGEDSNNLPNFLKNKYFSLNILSHDQIDLAAEFAKANNDLKWQKANYDISANNTPIFAGNLSYLECEKYDSYKIGDHEMIIGKVINCEVLNNQKALSYYDSKFGEIS